jgi:cytochrome c-type biogenesis protein CcmH
MPDLRRWLTLGLIVLAGAVVLYGLFAGDAGDEDRAEAISNRLRCPVCQSESLQDSNSETAIEMRTIVREQVAAGKSDDEIIDFFTARYGDWVLADPPASGSTLWVWVLPFVALAGGIWAIKTRLRTTGDTP